MIKRDQVGNKPGTAGDVDTALNREAIVYRHGRSAQRDVRLVGRVVAFSPRDARDRAARKFASWDGGDDGTRR
jgi:hypothetical protein